MTNITYLAVLEPSSDGTSYGVFFPDLPGCTSYGRSIDEALHMAAEAASLHVYGLENDGDPVPEPSRILMPEVIEGKIVAPITIHPDLFRMKKDNERVKTNITIPLWLKRLAEENGVNYSRLLEGALLEYLGISSGKS